MKLSFPNASQSFKQRNPELFGGAGGGLGGPCPSQPQQLDAPPLDNARPARQIRPQGVACRPRVTIIVLRRRCVDDDNLVGGSKYLRDAIADTLGLNDAAIDWEYHQIRTKGKPGTLVKVETTPHA